MCLAEADVLAQLHEPAIQRRGLIHIIKFHVALEDYPHAFRHGDTTYYLRHTMIAVIISSVKLGQEITPFP